MWPTILSLDAPAVALAWLGLFATVYDVHLRWSLYAALGLCVWLIYVGDRLLDSVAPPSDYEGPRHLFYRRHRRMIFPLAIVATVAIGAFSFLWIRPSVWRAELSLAGVVALYLTITHLGGECIRRYWPKELMVAILFAVGTLLPIWTLANSRAATLLAPCALVIGIFWVNALGIQCWESAPDLRSRAHLEPRVSRLLAVRLGAVSFCLTSIAGAVAVTRALSASDALIYGAIALSALLLAALEVNASRLSRPSLRVLADTALLTPGLFLLVRLI